MALPLTALIHRSSHSKAAAYGSCISQNATQIHGKGHCQKEFELFRECVRKSLVSRS
ncbi:hypothetical protein, variant [Fonticula alba]|uniref:CHCH domain-containing protein n=1 Tax=Fonticula alba TaxID=691883 RepID=A0A058ZBD6_FONAL|nr:hypothetical protein, variant [Fonticula alba]KCV71714.1 hypothetical protein, variant [Fonticula alba]|eukprot:XP_009493291.1 hypothetical protein, variant [Fonticula alba]